MILETLEEKERKLQASNLEDLKCPSHKFMILKIFIFYKTCTLPLIDARIRQF